MKNLNKEMLGVSGFRYDRYDCWYTLTLAGSHLCFKSSNPLRNLYNLVSLDARNKIHSEINEIVYDKTNNLNITISYEKNN